MPWKNAPSLSGLRAGVYKPQIRLRLLFLGEMRISVHAPRGTPAVLPQASSRIDRGHLVLRQNLVCRLASQDVTLVNEDWLRPIAPNANEPSLHLHQRLRSRRPLVGSVRRPSAAGRRHQAKQAMSFSASVRSSTACASTCASDAFAWASASRTSAVWVCAYARSSSLGNFLIGGRNLCL